MKLETYQLSMSVSWKTLANAANVGLSIAHVTLVVSAFGFSAVSTAQASGTSHKQGEGDQHAEAHPVEQLRAPVVLVDR